MTPHRHQSIKQIVSAIINLKYDQLLASNSNNVKATVEIQEIVDSLRDTLHKIKQVDSTHTNQARA